MAVVGPNLWQWEMWNRFDDGSKVLWLGLYTTTQAKATPVGLWYGSISTMADATGQLGDAVRTHLDQMIDLRAVEYDQRNKVLRMLELPDFAEAPHNDRAIHGWWNRFKKLPPCRVRDAHVQLLQQLYEVGISTGKTTVMAGAMMAAWQANFAKIIIPAPPVRLQRLSDSNTGTRSQPGLFDHGSTQSSDDSLPQLLLEAVPTLKSPPEEKQEDQKIRSGSVSPTVDGTTRPTGNREQEAGDGKRVTGDMERMSGSGSSSSSSPDQDPQVVAEHDPARTRLELVPPPAQAPFSVDDVLAALGLREDALCGLPRDELWDEIARLASAGMGRLELDLVATWVRDARVGPRDRIDILTTARLRDAVSRARRWADEKREREVRAAERASEFRAALEQATDHATKTGA
jgi:hypothetical protein